MPAERRGLTRSLAYGFRLAVGTVRRLGRLAVFGFEILVLSRLFERRGASADAMTTTLLAAKDIERLPPELEVTDSHGRSLASWRHGFAGVNASLFLNLQTPNRLSDLRHAHPGPPFRGVYLWDSAFIAQVWKGWDPQVAWEVLAAVIRLRDGDRLQHFASEYTRSKFTQPPLIAWSLVRLAREVPEAHARSWIAEAYPALAAYKRWLDAHRRLPNGLYHWAHPYESGVENAPRFSTTDERRLEDIRTWAAPDLCSYMVLQSEALAEMAATLGRDAEAAAHGHEADRIRALVNAHLWDPGEGLYFDLDTTRGRLVRSRTIASLLPLWAGIPGAARAERMHGRIVDPQGFGTLIPLPSVALDDPDFERDMWRGPVWLNTAYGVVEGLRRAGWHETASDMAFRLADGVYRTYQHHGHFYEFYDPTVHRIDALHRKRGNRWKKITLGSGPVADFVGWTGLVNMLVAEHLFGLQGRPGARALRPRFPRRAEGMRFTLLLAAEEGEVELRVGPEGRTRGELRMAWGTRPFEAAFGEPVLLAQEAEGSA